MQEFTFSTTRNEEIIDVTDDVKKIVKQSGLSEGMCLVYVPHSTAAVIINENWDPGVCEDVLSSLSRMVPKRAGYKHDTVDGNAAAHVKSAFLGPSETITFVDKKLILGEWQAVMLCEFDGPRKRRVIVQLTGR